MDCQGEGGGARQGRGKNSGTVSYESEQAKKHATRISLIGCASRVVYSAMLSKMITPPGSNAVHEALPICGLPRTMLIVLNAPL